ncbi:hypothetical protein D5086_014616 [Populus alba]|uniref:Uncharacterized protein n=1 Tax=Populus alba TaxID=43335 RepID=A0ACC4BYS2_POPAL
MNDDMLLNRLTEVKGIGVWSVHMFMLFSLHRPDVLPVGDLGVRKGVQSLYGLKDLPQALEMEQICEKWKPYRMDKILFVHYILETAFSCQGLLNQMKQDLNLETVHLNVYRSIVELVYMQVISIWWRLSCGHVKSYFSMLEVTRLVLDQRVGLLIYPPLTIAGTAIAHRWVEVKRNSVWDQV